MARDHEMVRSSAPIPVGVLMRHYIDIIGEYRGQSTTKGAGLKPEKAIYNFGHT